MMMNTLEQEDLIKGLPDDALIQYMQNPSGQLAQYLVASEIQHRTDMRNRFAAQEQQTEQTVAEQIVAEASPQQGVGALQPQMPPQPPMGAMPPSMQMQQPQMPPQMMPPPQMPPEMMAAQMPPAASQPQQVMMAGGGPIPSSIIEDAAKFSPESLYDIDPVQQSAMLNATNMGIPSVLPMARGGVVRMVRGGDVEVAKEEYERIVKENTDEDGKTNWGNVAATIGLGLSAGLTLFPTPMTKGIGAAGTTAIQAIKNAPKLFRGIASLGRSVPASLRGLQNRMYTRLGESVARGRNIPVPGARHPSLQPIPRSLRGELSPSAYARLGRENILEGLQQSILQPIRRVTREGWARGAGITGLGAGAYEYLGGLEESDSQSEASIIERLRAAEAAGHEIPPHLRQQYLGSPNKLRGGTTLPAMFRGGVVKMQGGGVPDISAEDWLESLDPREQINPNQFNPIPTSPLGLDPISIFNPDPRVREQERNARFFGDMTQEDLDRVFPPLNLEAPPTPGGGLEESPQPIDLETALEAGRAEGQLNLTPYEISQAVDQMDVGTTESEMRSRIDALEAMKGQTPDTFDVTESVLRSGERADERAISQALINLGAGIAAGDISKGFTDAGTAVSGIRQRQEEFQQLADVRRAEAESKASSDRMTRDISITTAQIGAYGDLQDQQNAANQLLIQRENALIEANKTENVRLQAQKQHEFNVAKLAVDINNFDRQLQYNMSREESTTLRERMRYESAALRAFAPSVLDEGYKLSGPQKAAWKPTSLTMPDGTPDTRLGWTAQRALQDLLEGIRVGMPSEITQSDFDRISGQTAADVTGFRVTGPG